MHFQQRERVRQVAKEIRHERKPAARLAGGNRVLLHLVPFRLAADHPCERLQRVVEPIEHEILRRIEEAFRPAPRDRIRQDVLHGRPEIRVPDEIERIDARVEERAPRVGDLLNGAVLADQAAMRPEQQVLALRCLIGDVAEDLLHIVGRCSVCAVGAQQAVVAEADDVRAEI